jgi:hypothetical protein
LFLTACTIVAFYGAHGVVLTAWYYDDEIEPLLQSHLSDFVIIVLLSLSITTLMATWQAILISNKRIAMLTTTIFVGTTASVVSWHFAMTIELHMTGALYGVLICAQWLVTFYFILAICLGISLWDRTSPSKTAPTEPT